MNKYSKLLQNSGLFLIANFGSKLISFIFVRFYTEILTTSEYGTIDILITTVFLVVPFITLGINEATIRFSIDEKTDKKSVFTNSIAVVLMGNLAFLVAIPLLSMSEGFAAYLPLFYLLLLCDCINAVFSQFIRGIGKTKIFAIAGIIQTVGIVSANIVLLAGFRLGITGYLLSSIFGYFASAI